MYTPFLKITNKLNLNKIQYQGFVFFMALDVPEHWQMNFQDPATPIMSKIIDLHHDIQAYLIIIVIFVLWILLRIVEYFNETKTRTIRYGFEHYTQIERIWTIIPTIILTTIAAPSFALLYLIDELHQPQITIKAIGHQWYWSYEYSDYDNDVEFDSYMINEDDLALGEYRLLEVDRRVKIPFDTSVRLLITSLDVLHSWAVPSLGIKMDACPGRLNQVSVYIERAGIYYGQCSELCGVNHGFMPIVVEGVPMDHYVRWLTKKHAFNN